MGNYIKFILITFMLAVVGCKSNTFTTSPRDSSVIESEDNYVPWWITN